MALASRLVPQRRASTALRARNFLADVVIDFGPARALSRLFLNADTQLRRTGINLTFSTFDELLAINRANAASWHPLVPVFDPEVSGIDDGNGLALVAWNAGGEAIAAIAARHYGLTDRSLKDELESLRLFYREPEAAARRGEHMEVTAPAAGQMRGNLIYMGGVWVRPDHRATGVHRMISPIARGLSYTRWNSDACFSLMVEDNISTGVARRARFLHTEWGANWTNSPVFGSGALELALVWTTGDEQLQHFAEYVAAIESSAGSAAVTSRRQTG